MPRRIVDNKDGREETLSPLRCCWLWPNRPPNRKSLNSRQQTESLLEPEEAGQICDPGLVRALVEIGSKAPHHFALQASIAFFQVVGWPLLTSAFPVSWYHGSSIESSSASAAIAARRCSLLSARQLRPIRASAPVMR